MEKKQVTVHAFTIHMYAVAVVVLGIALLALGAKYLHLKLSVAHYTQSAIWQQMTQQPTGSISDYGQIIATTIGQYPQGQALYTQPLSLENYVTNLSKSLKRDIVIVDTNQKIVADTIVANMGSKYSYDQNSEVLFTLRDGTTRSFTETSRDYPNGISELVTPIKNDKGQIVGAVIISNTILSR